MASLKIKKGDKVVVLSGKDKGKHGEVTKAMPKDGKVIVAGINKGAWNAGKHRFTCRSSQSKIQRRARQHASVLK
jgi:ribosomal protein L24